MELISISSVSMVSGSRIRFQHATCGANLAKNLRVKALQA
jgi:hypothetical protein